VPDFPPGHGETGSRPGFSQSPPGPDFPPARRYSGIAYRDSRVTNTMEIASGRGIEGGVLIV
jgi:hypothetical protein